MFNLKSKEKSNPVSVDEGKSLEAHFAPFREKIIGIDTEFEGPYGKRKIIYADWIASGRLYGPIEEKLKDMIGPYVANTHTETSYTGALMTQAYAESKQIIKQHVGASEEDVLIPTGTGMTGAIAKLQRMMGLKLPEQFSSMWMPAPEDRPVVFVSHMEHHSNQTNWLETLAEVQVIKADENGEMDLNHFADLLEEYKDRKIKIASVTSCSNVTGVFTPYHKVAKMVHRAGGLCFIDFACSGPYVDINMHPEDPEESLDAIFFSPHKFLGGPGTPGILIFNKKLYSNKIPDTPGGGTVSWTNPWGGHKYISDIEAREDGGTPGFLQTIKAAMAVKLKEEMNTEKMLEREHELVSMVLDRMEKIPGMHVLAGNLQERLGAISFFHNDIHFNLFVRLLNDRFGIQTRGGCSCAGTYGHYLLNIDSYMSDEIIKEVSAGDLSRKPGWVRLSLHPTMTNEEVKFICGSLEEIVQNKEAYCADYRLMAKGDDFEHKSFQSSDKEIIGNWFNLG
jgi:selenocysteine lyase/cysteine desulfurase